MAKDDTRREVAWASFCAPARLDSMASGASAIASSDRTKLFMGLILGVAHLIIEDETLPLPSCIPWTNIASVGWVK